MKEVLSISKTLNVIKLKFLYAYYRPLIIFKHYKLQL